MLALLLLKNEDHKDLAGKLIKYLDILQNPIFHNCN